MSASSLDCHQLMVNYSMVSAPTLKMLQNWMKLQVVFGVVVLHAHCLMCEYLIPMLLVTTTPDVTESMRREETSIRATCDGGWTRFFTPLVLSATGGMANVAGVFYSKLASCLATKWDQPYSLTMSWLWCWFTFSLLWSSIQCITGACSSWGYVTKPPSLPLDLHGHIRTRPDLVYFQS